MGDLRQKELLALARGGATVKDLSNADLLKLSYRGGSPLHTAEDYRKHLYGPLGKPFRWFMRIDDPKMDQRSGTAKYQEQLVALNGTPMTDVRCLVWDSSERLEGAEYGEKLEKRTMFGVLPEEVEMGTGDLALLTEPRSAMGAFNRFVKGEQGKANFDPLPHWPCSSIVGIWVDGVRLPPTAYQAAPLGIQWLSGAPAQGTRFSVRWKYLPLYQWSENEQGFLQLGDDNSPLPQIGEVHLLRDFKPTQIVAA